MSTSMPICPLLSIRSAEIDELCLGDSCALFLPQARKCSLVFLGYKALLEVQRMTPPAAGSPPKA
jgi:hypothetical protein